MEEQHVFLSQLLPNTIALAGGMRHGERFCAQDLHMLCFHTAVYSPTKQPAKPIYLNRLYGNLDYLLCNYMAGLATWFCVFHNFLIFISDLFNFMTTDAFFLSIHYLTMFT
jgi:hypothetical protein